MSTAPPFKTNSYTQPGALYLVFPVTWFSFRVEVMGLAKRGSVRHLEQLWDGMSRYNYSLEALGILLAHLAIPNSNVVTPEQSEVPFRVLANGLSKAASRYPPSLAIEIVQRIAAASEGILFWMNLFTEGGSDPHSEWTFEDPNGQNGYNANKVHNYTSVLLLLLAFEAVIKSMGQLPAMHNLILRWWTATCDGEVLLYPGRGRDRPPQEFAHDNTISIFFLLAKDFAKEMAAAIMTHPTRSEATP